MADEITNETAQTVAAGQLRAFIERVERLGLNWDMIGSAGLRRILERAQLSERRALDLRRNLLRDEGAERLAAAELPSLIPPSPSSSPATGPTTATPRWSP